jgi:hypothetical protein
MTHVMIEWVSWEIGSVENSVGILKLHELLENQISKHCMS